MAPSAAAQGVVFQTSVAPKPEEDILADCRYEITIPNPSRPIRAVWVIFDRGRDTLRYYGDSEVQAFAYRRDLALLLPFLIGEGKHRRSVMQEYSARDQTLHSA